jgi:hypothetical protein
MDKLNLEEVCKEYEVCRDKKKCDGKGNLDYGRYLQACDKYQKQKAINLNKLKIMPSSW